MFSIQSFTADYNRLKRLRQWCVSAGRQTNFEDKGDAAKLTSIARFLRTPLEHFDGRNNESCLKQVRKAIEKHPNVFALEIMQVLTSTHLNREERNHLMLRLGDKVPEDPLTLMLLIIMNIHYLYDLSSTERLIDQYVSNKKLSKPRLLLEYLFYYTIVIGSYRTTLTVAIAMAYHFPAQHNIKLVAYSMYLQFVAENHCELEKEYINIKKLEAIFSYVSKKVEQNQIVLKEHEDFEVFFCHVMQDLIFRNAGKVAVRSMFDDLTFRNAGVDIGAYDPTREFWYSKQAISAHFRCRNKNHTWINDLVIELQQQTEAIKVFEGDGVPNDFLHSLGKFIVYCLYEWGMPPNEKDRIVLVNEIDDVLELLLSRSEFKRYGEYFSVIGIILGSRPESDDLNSILFSNIKTFQSTMLNQEAVLRDLSEYFKEKGHLLEYYKVSIDIYKNLGDKGQYLMMSQLAQLSSVDKGFDEKEKMLLYNRMAIYNALHNSIGGNEKFIESVDEVYMNVASMLKKYLSQPDGVGNPSLAGIFGLIAVFNMYELFRSKDIEEALVVCILIARKVYEQRKEYEMNIVLCQLQVKIGMIHDAWSNMNEELEVKNLLCHSLGYLVSGPLQYLMPPKRSSNIFNCFYNTAFSSAEDHAQLLDRGIYLHNHYIDEDEDTGDHDSMSFSKDAASFITESVSTRMSPFGLTALMRYCVVSFFDDERRGSLPPTDLIGMLEYFYSHMGNDIQDYEADFSLVPSFTDEESHWDMYKESYKDNLALSHKMWMSAMKMVMSTHSLGFIFPNVVGSDREHWFQEHDKRVNEFQEMINEMQRNFVTQDKYEDHIQFPYLDPIRYMKESLCSEVLIHCGRYISKVSRFIVVADRIILLRANAEIVMAEDDCIRAGQDLTDCLKDFFHVTRKRFKEHEQSDPFAMRKFFEYIFFPIWTLRAVEVALSKVKDSFKVRFPGEDEAEGAKRAQSIVDVARLDDGEKKNNPPLRKGKVKKKQAVPTKKAEPQREGLVLNEEKQQFINTFAAAQCQLKCMLLQMNVQCSAVFQDTKNLAQNSYNITVSTNNLRKNTQNADPGNVTVFGKTGQHMAKWVHERFPEFWTEEEVYHQCEILSLGINASAQQQFDFVCDSLKEYIDSFKALSSDLDDPNWIPHV